jgi:hypothetical protein
MAIIFSSWDMDLVPRDVRAKDGKYYSECKGWSAENLSRILRKCDLLTEDGENGPWFFEGKYSNFNLKGSIRVSLTVVSPSYANHSWVMVHFYNEKVTQKLAGQILAVFNYLDEQGLDFKIGAEFTDSKFFSLEELEKFFSRIPK